MVNSPWKGQCSPCPGVEKQIRPYHFERSQWQRGTEPNLWYLLWRWCLALAFVSICIYSICNPHLRTDNSNNSPWKWPAFLTNWAYIVCTVQAVLGLWIVQCSWINKTNPKETNRQLPKVYHFYWAMHNLAVDMALVVSLIYWTLVYDSSVHHLDTLNFLVHGANSVMMMTDMFLVMHPTRLIYILNAFGLGIIYIVFSYIYFALGGTDRDGRPFIYAALDWRKPGRAVCFTLLCLTILAVIHCVAYCFYRFRVRLAWRANFSTPSENLTPQDKPMLVELA